MVYRFPKLTTGSNVYFVGEAISAPEAVIATGSVELTARKLMVALAISAELQEDRMLSSINCIKTVKRFKKEVCKNLELCYN